MSEHSLGSISTNRVPWSAVVVGCALMVALWFPVTWVLVTLTGPWSWDAMLGPIGFVVLLGVLVGALSWLALPGIRTASDDPDFPRPFKGAFAIQKFGEEIGWWPYRDMYGLHDLISARESDEVAIIRLVEVQSKRETREDIIVEPDLPGITR